MRLARDPPNTELYSHTQSSLSMSRPLQVHLTPDSKSRRSEGAMVPPPANLSTPSSARSWMGASESDRKSKRRGTRGHHQQARKAALGAKGTGIKNGMRRGKLASSSSETTPLPIVNGRVAGGWTLAGIGGGVGSGGPDYVERSSTNTALAFT